METLFPAAGGLTQALASAGVVLGSLVCGLLVLGHLGAVAPRLYGDPGAKLPLLVGGIGLALGTLLVMQALPSTALARVPQMLGWP